MLKFEDQTRKIINACMEVHKAQVLNYLNASKSELGLLVNFGETSLKWERITRFNIQELR